MPNEDNEVNEIRNDTELHKWYETGVIDHDATLTSEDDKKSEGKLSQLQRSFLALPDNERKIQSHKRAAETISLLVSYLISYHCGTATDLSEEAVRDVFNV